MSDFAMDFIQSDFLFLQPNFSKLIMWGDVTKGNGNKNFICSFERACRNKPIGLSLLVAKLYEFEDGKV